MANSSALLNSRREVFSYSLPYEVLAAKNATVRLRGASGHIFSFTDLTSANGAVNFGHLNPGIDPFGNLTSDLVSQYYPPQAAGYARWLLKQLNLKTHSVAYRAGTGAAVRAAIELAQRLRPGKVAVLDRSSHLAGESPTGLEVVRISPGSDMANWKNIACLLYEPVLTESGYVPLPLPWLRGLSQAAQASGVLVIADETQTGFFRFGKLSLAASEFLLPDVLLFGNSMTNGIYPLAAMVLPESLVEALPERENESDGSAHGNWDNTFQTSSLGFLAAEAVARYMDATPIGTEVAEINRILGQAGECLAANPILSAFHLAGPTLSFEVRGARAGALVGACQARGVLLSAGAGERRVRVAPPVTIQPDTLTQALKVLKKTAAAL